MENRPYFTPSRVKSARLGSPAISQPLGSALYPTKYPLSLSSSIRSNDGGDGTEGVSDLSYNLDGSSQMCPQASSSTYEAPKFRTFQERKRDKERQLALAAGREWCESSETIPLHESTRHPQPWQQDSISRIETHASASPSSSRSPTPSWPGRDPSLILPGIGIPLAPSNVLPLERRTGSTGASRRPLPLPTKQADVIANGLVPDAQTPATNRVQTVQRPLPSTGIGGITPTPGLQSFPSASTRADSPSSPSGARRLPKPKSLANIVTSSARHGSTPMNESSDTAMFARTTAPALPSGSAIDYSPIWQRNSFARSDTVTSVKSLDRFGTFQSSERPLPAPPVVIGSSRSLDRGPKAISPIQTPPGNFQAASQAERSWRPAQPPLERSDASAVHSEAYGLLGSPIANPNPIIVGPNGVDSARHPSNQADVPGRIPSPLRSYAYSSIPKISVATIAAEEAEVAPPTVPSIVLPGVTDLEDDLMSITINVPTVPTLVMPDEEQPVTQSDVRPVQQSGTGIFCARCDTAIIGRIVSAMDRRWHPQCFQCSTCHTLLEHVSSYEHEGKAYCHMDYHDVSD